MISKMIKPIQDKIPIMMKLSHSLFRVVAINLFLFYLILCIDGDLHGGEKRPDVVIILVDDMGYSDLGCYGSEIETPNIDRLASRGLRFTQFYNTAKCYTTRASLLTGLYHQKVLESKTLTDNCATLAETLGAFGYFCTMSGKWHLNGGMLDDRKLQPLSRGFDRFFGTILGAGSFFNPHTLQKGYERIKPPKDFYYTDAITDHAVKMIQESDTHTPSFHFIAYTAPHWPMHIPSDDSNVEKYRKIYSAGWDDLRLRRFRKMKEYGLLGDHVKLSDRDRNVPEWGEGIENREWQIERMSVYASMLERVDSGVGQIVKALEQKGTLNKTLLMFLSDNGGSPENIGFNNGLNTLGKNQFTENGEKIQIGSNPKYMPGPEVTYQGVGREWANLNNVPFRQFKTFSHHGGIASPLVIHWPDGIENGGRIVHQMAHLIDVVPTCLDVSGISTPQSIGGRKIQSPDGISLSSYICKSDVEPISRSLYFSFGGKAAIRDGDWKLVTASQKSKDWELYFIPDDPTEINNLAKKYPGIVSRLSKKFKKWAIDVGAQSNSR